MKKNLLLIVCALSFSSCGTLFTSSKQSLTFMGLPETKIYDNSQKLGEISEDGTATIRVKKSLTSKTLLAKKTDTNTPQLHFNPRLIQYVYLICLTQLPG